jgi:starch synthase
VPAQLALVHHANQFLITNGYLDRQGIDDILEGYAAVLRLHEQHKVFVNLHLSGTLIETAAWHCPWFLEMVKQLRAQGVVELVGGVYAETVMTLFSHDFNVAQLDELLFLYREHLGCPPEDVRVCWVPERVWDTEKLAPALTSQQLLNGGYEAVLLDDRLLYPTGGSYAGSPRAAFDAVGPFEHGSTDGSGLVPDEPDTHRADAHTVYEISGSKGLLLVPISADVRHWIPPTRLEHWSHLEDMVQTHAGEQADDCVLIYADDLERTAGVGGWPESLLDPYDAFLRWVSERDDVVAVPLSSQRSPRRSRKPQTIERGTFFELAQVWGAGDDYGRWADGAEWGPYRRYLNAAHDDLNAAEEEGADKKLLELCRKHLSASTYETAWHDPAEWGHAPARWAKAVASHARSCHVITAAARWFAESDRGLDIRVADVDGDGEDELIVANANLFAVVSPGQGGRLVYLFSRAEEGGVLMIGNPADDWHIQEELNRYMVTPPNHPGALADVGFECDAYRTSIRDPRQGSVRARMTNVQRGSLLFGARKTLVLTENVPVLSVCYRLPADATEISVESCLSPDYYRLLREGPRGLTRYDGPRRRGFRFGDAAVWIALTPGERTAWTKPAHPRVGHGMNVQLLAETSHFHLSIGCGPVDDEAGGASGLLERAGQGED